MSKSYEAVSPHMVVLRLAHEMVLSRVRHRALLDVLASENFSMERYFESFKNLLNRDGAAIFARLMLDNDDFKSVFKEWLEQDNARYHCAHQEKTAGSAKKRKKSG